MITPTIRNLEMIAGFASAREVIEFARSLTDIDCIRPRVVQRNGVAEIVLPGEMGYDD